MLAKQVQIAFMFEHWMAVRTGALANIGQLLRIGKLPGFEEGTCTSACLENTHMALRHISFFACSVAHDLTEPNRGGEEDRPTDVTIWH